MVTDYYLPTLGGVQTVIKAHREALERDGHEVFVFAPLAGPSSDPHVVRLPTARGFAPDGYPFTWTPAAAAEALGAGLRTHGIEVVHVHTEMFAALAGFQAARAQGVPVVQTMHGRIDVYTRSVLPMPSVTTAVLAAMHRRRLTHESGLHTQAPYVATRTARRMWTLMVSQANHADHVIVPSQHFATKLLDQGVRTRLSVLSNGLEDSVLAEIGTPSPRIVDPQEPLRVVWCGRLSPEKRPEVFHDAVAQVPGIRAEMFGDGVARKSVTAAAAALPDGRLTVHGGVTQSRVLEAMRDAHVLVSTSLDFDNQPMVILEAIAAGLPVVVTDPELAGLLPQGAGTVTTTPDADALARALRDLIRDPDRVTQMSAASIAARADIAQSTHLEALLDVYRSVLNAS